MPTGPGRISQRSPQARRSLTRGVRDRLGLSLVFGYRAAIPMSISTVIVAVNAMLLRRFHLIRGGAVIDQEALPAYG
ncbi:MAG: hypothetical protein V3S62_09340 [Acidimicrobiia bacterium]